MIEPIPIIDLFAGPGGLGEGFSALYEKDERAFRIKLSIEKDENAHKTLELRSFFRQFKVGHAPQEYYNLIQEKDLNKRAKLRIELFERYPKESKLASTEAWCAELGSPLFPSSVVDKRIRSGIGKCKNWVLIGGPPCQAYSLVGRSRVGGIDEDDPRVYLYKEYLRIIAKHHPAVFVMENVKGLLSAKVNDERVFDWMKRDLENPARAFDSIKESPSYRVFSLVAEPDSYGSDGSPIYTLDRKYLIKSEDYGVPQKRHRVILLGVREDIKTSPRILEKHESEISLKEVIQDLPRIRSGLNRSFTNSINKDGVVTRCYIPVTDGNEEWKVQVNAFRNEIISWNGFAKGFSNKEISAPKKGKGSEFVKCKTPAPSNPLYSWYYDSKLDGVPNHQSRSHLVQDLKRYMFSSMFAKTYKRFPRLHEFDEHSEELLPDHGNVGTGKFVDRFRVQTPDRPATTITSHISKDGHYFIHYDPNQCRSLTVREAARVQSFPDNYLFCGARTAQYHQVGNAVPPYLAYQIAGLVHQLLRD